MLTDHTTANLHLVWAKSSRPKFILFERTLQEMFATGIFIARTRDCGGSTHAEACR
jgi:hypothetical protein